MMNAYCDILVLMFIK